MEIQHQQGSLLKPTLILTSLLFLLIAPAPDSRDIAEMSAEFLVPETDSGLMASSEPVRNRQEEILN